MKIHYPLSGLALSCVLACADPIESPSSEPSSLASIGHAVQSGSCVTQQVSAVAPGGGAGYPAPTAFSVTAGREYEVTASGTYFANDGLYADARYSSRFNGPWQDTPANYERHGPTLLDLQFWDGTASAFVSPNWGAFSSSHVYSTRWTAISDQLRVRINEDYAGNNSGSLSVTVCQVADNSSCPGDVQGPTLILHGSSAMTLECGVDSWADPGAEAWDVACTPLEVHRYNSGSDPHGPGPNTSEEGTYSVQYTAWNSAGTTVSAIRSVQVDDRRPPTLTLRGPANMTHTCGSQWVDPGVVAMDACYGDVAPTVRKVGEVNGWVSGTYTVVYEVADSGGNSATPIKRTVQVANCPWEEPCVSNPGICADPTLIGQWSFNAGAELADSTGHWGALELKGATVSGGKLAVRPGMWARVTGYRGAAPLREKTLVAWGALNRLDVRTGALMSVDSVTWDNFDALVYGEIHPQRWLAGSSHFRRTQDVVTVDETIAGQRLQMAVSYKDLGNNNVQVTLCRDGVQLGQYTSPNMTQWNKDDLEVLFGARHTIGSQVLGSLNADLDEARLYAKAMNCAEVKALGSP
jgi:hypothetical protein